MLIQKVWNIKIPTVFKTDAILSCQRLYKMHVTNRSNVDVTHANTCGDHWPDTQHGVSTL